MFHKDFVQDSKKDSSSPEQKAKRIELAERLDKIQGGGSIELYQGSVLLEVVKSLKPIRVLVHQIMLNVICRFFRGHKGHRKIQQLADFKTAQLDIRSLISNSIALKDYFRCALSHQQRILLAKQRSRVAECDDDEPLHATHGSDNDPLALG